MNVLNAHDDADRALWVRSVKAAAVIFCGVIPAIVLGMDAVDLLADGRRGLGEAATSWLVLAVVLLSPAALYSALIRTKVPVVCLGIGLIVLQLWSVWDVGTSESSTGGMAILWIPVAGVPFVLLGWAVDLWIRAMRPLSPPA